MSNTQDRNQTRKPAGLVATILLVLVLGVGYASPRVESAVTPPDAVEDLDPGYVPSECVVDGLVFGDCLLDY